MFQEPTLYIVKGMCILDNEGNRILAKYYDKNVLPTTKEQKAFEKNLFTKTHRYYYLTTFYHYTSLIPTACIGPLLAF